MAIPLTPLAKKIQENMKTNPNLFKPAAAQAPSTTGVTPPASIASGTATSYTGTPKTAGSPSTGVVPPMSAVGKANNPNAQSTTAINRGAMPMPNAAISPAGVMPATGYGGATYGSSAGANQAITANQGAIKNTPGFAQSEVARTQAVIAARQAQGLDTSAQQKYLTTNLGYAPPAEDKGMVTTAGAYPPMEQGDPYGQLSRDQIGTEAQAQLDRERAGLQTAATKRLTDLKNSFDYSNKLLQDNRVLENGQMDRTLNPFSGRTSYDKAMVNRGRGIDDSNRASQFNAEVSAVQEDLYNFDRLAPERQQQVINELTRLERAYGVDVAQLTGNFGGQRTIAGQGLDLQRDQFGWQQSTDQRDYDRGIVESDRGYDYQKGRDQVGDKRYENEFNRDVLESDRNFDRAKYESDRNYRFQVQQQSISSGQWQKQFNMDVQKLGFQQASELWSQAFQENQAGQDDARQKAQLDQEMTQADRTAAFQATDAIMKSGLVSKTTDMKTGQESMSVTNPKSLSDYIKSLDLSDNATDSLLYQYGLGSYVKK